MNPEQLIEEQKAKLKKLGKKADKIRDKIESYKKELSIFCQKCKAEYKIGNVTYIQSKYYVHPYSCMGGDYYLDGEGGWKCDCGHHNRLYKYPEIEKLKYSFKDVVDDYSK